MQLKNLSQLLKNQLINWSYLRGHITCTYESLFYGLQMILTLMYQLIKSCQHIVYSQCVMLLKNQLINWHISLHHWTLLFHESISKSTLRWRVQELQ